MELKPCPFCGGAAYIEQSDGLFYAECESCHVCTALYYAEDKAVFTWNRRASEVVKVETNLYDKEEIYPDCTVQVLTNTATGDVSVGWWKNETD